MTHEGAPAVLVIGARDAAIPRFEDLLHRVGFPQQAQ
jgi:hypothetical protein